MNLNIEHHTRIHVKTALNRFKTIKEAAKALGVSDRTVHRYIKLYGYEKAHDGLLKRNGVRRK